MTLFTIGSDIELPLKNKRTKKFVSAIPYLTGTKHDPEILENGSMLSRDNVALEFAIPPCETEDQFFTYIKDTIKICSTKIPEPLRLCISCYQEFPEKELDHPEAKLSGCDPDYDAWYNGGINLAPSLSETCCRSFAGHIHIGATDKTEFLLVPKYQNNFVKTLDLFLGVASVILDGTNKAQKRRYLYGRAGCYRRPAHGIEYRTLGNYWIKTENLIRLHYKLTMDAINSFINYNLTNYHEITNYNVNELIKFPTSSIYSINALKLITAFHKLNLIQEDTWELFTKAIKVKSIWNKFIKINDKIHENPRRYRVAANWR